MNRKALGFGEWITPVCIVGLAAFLRLYRLDSVPPAFNFDEAAHAIDALDILAGHHFLFSPKLQGVESFFMYCAAGAFYLLGPSPFAQRLVSALVGTATVAVTYFIVREMFYEEGERKKTWLAVFTALGLATSFWHVNYSRIGLEVSMTPFFAALSFCFLWRGLRRDRTWDYILSGIFMGLNPYTHLPARFMPFPVVLFFIVRFLMSLSSWHRNRESRQTSQGFWVTAWQSFRPLVIVGLAALVTYAPMGVYFVLHPADFLGRSAITSIFNPTMNGGDFWGTLWRSLTGTFGAFGFTSDFNWLANLPGKSILNIPMAVLFWLGVIITLLRIRRLPYLFVFLVWSTLLIPAVITPERTPHYSRMMITACVAYVFPALSLVELGGVLEYALHLGRNMWFTLSAPELRYSVGYPETCPLWQRWTAGGIRVLAYAAVASLFVLTGVSTYRDYFDVWAKSDAHYMAFDGYAVELAEHIRADGDPSAVYIIPRDIRAGEFYPHYTLDFLLRNGEPYRYVPMQEGKVSDLLTEACRGKNVVHLIRWKMDKHKEADPKQYVDMLLERFGAFQNTFSFPAYDIVTYQLPSAEVDFSVAPRYAPVNANFDGRLVLESAAYGNAAPPSLDEGHDVPSGGMIWLMLRWQKIAPFDEDYRVSVILEDELGHVIHHQDRDLIHEWHMRTGMWPQQEAVVDYHLLLAPAGTPPGTYTLGAVVYDALTMQRLSVDGKATTVAPLGHVYLLPPTELPVREAAVPQYPLDVQLGGGTVLEGFDMDFSRPYSPGANMTVVLHWRVKELLPSDQGDVGDVQLTFALQSDDRRMNLGPAMRPLGDGYPTDQWQPGQYWRSIHDLRLPAEASGGDYPLLLSLSRADTGRMVEEVTLGNVAISGRAHRFEMPEIRRPQPANLSDQVRFLGYDLDATNLKPEGSLGLTLHWQAMQPMDTSYTVFVHLLDQDNQVHAQKDFIPGNGEMPTTGWVKDEIISDSAQIDLPPDTQPGEYTLEIGMYNAANGQRLAILDEAGNVVSDHIILGQVDIP